MDDSPEISGIVEISGILKPDIQSIQSFIKFKSSTVHDSEIRRIVIFKFIFVDSQNSASQRIKELVPEVNSLNEAPTTRKDDRRAMKKKNLDDECSDNGKLLHFK